MARIPAAAALLMALSCATALGQYSQIGAPFNSVGNSFYENVGVSWGLQGNGWFARFGGGAPGVAPPFGGFDPGAQAQFGTAFRSGDVSGFLNFTAGQGSDTFIGGQSASVVLPNGGFGLISDTLQRPFVLGVVPVVGAEPVSPVEERLSRLRASGGIQPLGRTDDSRDELKLGAKQPSGGAAGGGSSSERSSADRGELSVAEIRARQAANDVVQTAEVDALVEKAVQAESAGKLGLARIYYRQASRHASGSRKTEIEGKLRAIYEQLKAPSDR